MLKTFLIVSASVFAFAASAKAADSSSHQPQIIVTGQRATDPLDQVTQAGSRLGLTTRETPATIETITQTIMLAKGLRTTVEAYDSAPGVVAGLLPGEPASASIRGFSTGAVSYLFDGMRAADSTILNRNYDSFNFERIEILKGPASVLYGDGALAGAINLVPKTPLFDKQQVDVLASYGSFNTVRLGVGINQPLSPNIAFRTDLSLSRSDGYVHDTNSRTIQSTSSLKLQPLDNLSVLLAFDYYGDRNRTPYQGAPLVPRSVARDPSNVVRTTNGYVLDKAMRDENYNVTDGRMDSDAYWGRGRVSYDSGEGWTLTDEINAYKGKRQWENSEDFTYNQSSGLLDRSTTKIYHDQDFWSNRAYLTASFTVAGLRNRMNLGVEYSRTRFQTIRRFGDTTAVALFDPARGSFPVDIAANYPGNGNRANYDSRIVSWAVFAEDALNLNDKWLLLGGLRFDDIQLHRRIDDLNTMTTNLFGRSFKAVSGRIGTTYDLAPKTQLFAQYSHAITPVGSLLLSNSLRASVDLTKGDSIEGGLKASLFADRLTLTASAYTIRQAGILTRDPARPSIQVQGGTQSSRGLEFSAVGNVTRALTIDANAAVLKARYDRLTNGSGVDLSGNRPVNVPQRTANLTIFYSFDGLPVTASAAVRHVGDIYTSTANDIRVQGYTIMNAALIYRAPWATFTIRGRNLANKFYAYWSGYSDTQVFVGAPRSVEITVSSKF